MRKEERYYCTYEWRSLPYSHIRTQPQYRPYISNLTLTASYIPALSLPFPSLFQLTLSYLFLGLVGICSGYLKLSVKFCLEFSNMVIVCLRICEKKVDWRTRQADEERERHNREKDGRSGGKKEKKEDAKDMRKKVRGCQKPTSYTPMSLCLPPKPTFKEEEKEKEKKNNKGQPTPPNKAH